MADGQPENKRHQNRGAGEVCLCVHQISISTTLSWHLHQENKNVFRGLKWYCAEASSRQWPNDGGLSPTARINGVILLR